MGIFLHEFKLRLHNLCIWLQLTGSGQAVPVDLYVRDQEVDVSVTCKQNPTPCPSPPT